jgi:hypothetical protein
MPEKPLHFDEWNCRTALMLKQRCGKRCIERGKPMFYLAEIPRFLLLAVAVIGAFTATSGYSQAESGQSEAVLERLKQDDLRVSALGFRLATANSARCARQMPGTGLILHSIDQYRGAWRAPAIRVFGAIGHVSIEGVVARSPAAQAGLAPGDELVAINGQQLEMATAVNKGATSRRDRAEDTLIALPVRDPIRLSVVRAGKTMDFVLRPVPACLARFELVVGSARFARSDGRLIQLGQELVRTLADEEIAFVLSHELAHSILDHRAQLAKLERQTPRKAAGKQRAILARDFEDQADRLAVRLLAQAGFDPSAAPRFMRRFGTSFDKVSVRGGIHRPARQRADLMEAEIAKLQLERGG